MKPKVAPDLQRTLCMQYMCPQYGMYFSLAPYHWLMQQLNAVLDFALDPQGLFEKLCLAYLLLFSQHHWSMQCDTEADPRASGGQQCLGEHAVPSAAQMHPCV